MTARKPGRQGERRNHEADRQCGDCRRRQASPQQEREKAGEHVDDGVVLECERDPEKDTGGDHPPHVGAVGWGEKHERARHGGGDERLTLRADADAPEPGE